MRPGNWDIGLWD
uniref:Uncharacterized protein n=1 Tax=Rhizophora mucronata TaxID=61149 RepID=A0A2P2P233_RHIMU